MPNKITIQTIVNAPIDKVWKCYNTPADIQQWNQASADWHCPYSENDLKPGGKFKHTMAAKDGSFSFDFSGVYDTIHEPNALKYHLDNNRQVAVEFIAINDDSTQIIQQFEPENTNPIEMQQAGWQAILDSFKHYTESIKDETHA